MVKSEKLGIPNDDIISVYTLTSVIFRSVLVYTRS